MNNELYEIKALTQANWEDAFSKKEILKNIRKSLNKDDQFKDLMDNAFKALMNFYFEEYNNWYIQKQEAWDYIVKEQLQENIILKMFSLVCLNQYCNIQAIVGQMHKMLPELPMMRAIQTLSEILVVLADKVDLWEVYSPNASEEGVIMVESHYSFDEDLLQYIANTKYLPPMLVRPKLVNSNYDYDYFNTKSSKILGSANHHNKPISLDVINICNGTKLKLDTFMLQFDEKPNKELDTVKKVEQFNRMAKASRDVYDMIIEMGNEFYITHKYDKRGRLYSQGYHINVQSTDYKKSLISLAQGELLDNF